MMTIKINDEELEALDELPHWHRSLYLFGIRPHADNATSIAGGSKRRISYQSLAEAVHVPPTPGTREAFQASKQQLRRALWRLEASGLVEIQSASRELILRLPLMDIGGSKKEQVDDSEEGGNRHIRRCISRGAKSGRGNAGRLSSIPKITKRIVIERDSLKCRYCGAELTALSVTLDHVTPVIQGGSNEPNNLVVACKPCNSQKGSRTPGEAGMTLKEVENA